jgi:hypothetical protein
MIGKLFVLSDLGKMRKDHLLRGLLRTFMKMITLVHLSPIAFLSISELALDGRTRHLITFVGDDRYDRESPHVVLWLSVIGIITVHGFSFLFVVESLW